MSKASPTREQVMHALAQAYCHERNASKEMDIDLVVAMADEIMKVFDADGDVSTREDEPDAG
jgi:hypothetical protein